MRQWPEILNPAEWPKPDWARLADERRRELFFGAVIILILTVTGPFGTGGDLVWPFRLLYWAFVVLAAGFSVQLIAPALRDTLAVVEPPLARMIVLAAIIAVPVTLVIVIVEMIFRQFMPLIHWPAIYLGVVVILASLNMLTRMRSAESREGLTGVAKPSSTAAATPPPAPAAANPLSIRLPDHMKNEPVLALKAEDHYLRVFTPAGDDRVLMRLSDAIQALGAETGIQVHRSWWVARDAVADVQRSGNKGQLRLTDGTEVPISRRRLAALADEGLV